MTYKSISNAKNLNQFGLISIEKGLYTYYALNVQIHKTY